MPIYLTAKKFLLQLNQPNKYVRFDDCHVEGKLTITRQDFNCKGIVLTQCKFNETIVFDEVDLKAGLIVRGSEFQQNFLLKKCITTEYDPEFNNSNRSIEFENCKTNFIFINETSLKRGIKFSKTSISGISITLLRTPENGINFNETEVKDSLDLHHCSIENGDISFHKGKVSCKTRFENVLIKNSLTFKDANFTDDLHIWAGEAAGGIIFNDGLFEDNVYITAVKSQRALSIIGSEFKKNLYFDYIDKIQPEITGGCPKIFLKDCKFQNSLQLNGGKDLTRPRIIEEIQIQATNSLGGGDISVLNFSIGQLDLSGSNYNGNFIFSHCRIHQLKIENFYNYSNLHLSNIRSSDERGSGLEIVNSFLGKTHFSNVSLASFDSMFIWDSYVAEIITSGVNWFNVKHLNQYATEIKGEHFWAKNRELFRQFKYAMEKQGDGVQSLIFKSAEMRALRKELNFSSGRCDDRFMMWLNQSNNYGLNWTKPLFIALSISLLFYFVIIVSFSDEIGCYPSLALTDIKHTAEIFHKYLYLFPYLFNPVRSLHTILDTDYINFWTSFWDVLQRIIIGYLIFQTVSAFRKYVKS